MRLNIPLIPIQIDVRVQLGARYRPLRAVRFSIRVLMLVVAITAIFCSLWVWFQTYQGRLARANNYHGEQAFDPFLPGVVNRPWHAKMYHEYHAALLRNGMIANTLLRILLLSVAAFIIGRIMNWLYRRSHPPHWVRSSGTFEGNLAFPMLPPAREDLL
jgi:hypothetical protein